MNFFESPQYFGIEDNTVTETERFGVRVYYPTEDDVIVGAPLPAGPHPLVVFAHGYRGGSQNAHLCPPDITKDNCRWTLVLGAIARSGFVVAAPALPHNNANASRLRLLSTVQWMREQWHGRRTLHLPLEVDPGIGTASRVPADVHEARVQGADQPSEMARIHLPEPPVVLGRPTALAVVGHSWGARAGALLTANIRVQAFAAIAGVFDDNDSPKQLHAARIPTLLMCGTAGEEGQTFSYLNALWPSLATPKYQAAFKGVDHWGWFGPKGAIRPCDGSSPATKDDGHIAGELLAGFLTRHVARLQFDPPQLVPIPLLRPWLVPWHDYSSAIQVRWDAPGQHFYPLPPAGDGILGPWAAGTAPW